MLQMALKVGEAALPTIPLENNRLVQVHCQNSVGQCIIFNRGWQVVYTLGCCSV